ncbi:hypothetical protein F5B22DRAFT_643860 [Xylaria bambusicola]|uniref:uncharacterized protein n=1 Tax=Xylaria bambusicola TaxID=326684 RepID=UPI002008AD50|nr:uncharacterized protein F5B22DRAFT_643860 [Xylaria bambusicola]KAI0521689.1 hypothetical protein F5B22DRAFT_643860 [Xylaria bambusicola]
MAPKLSLKTPPFYTLDTNPTSCLRAPHAHTHTQWPRHRGVKSDLQKKLSTVVRRVLGTSASLSSLSSSSSCSSPLPSPHLPSSSSYMITPRIIADDDDDDECSNYGDVEDNDINNNNSNNNNKKNADIHRTKSITSPSSLSSAHSYSSLASLNPYTADAADVAALLYPCLPLPATPQLHRRTTERRAGEVKRKPITIERIQIPPIYNKQYTEYRQEKIDSAHIARLVARELDLAHAAVVAEEGVALRALKDRTRLDWTSSVPGS